MFKELKLDKKIRLLYGGGLSFRSKLMLSKSPRFKSLQISFFKKPLSITDAASFLAMYREIFLNNHYQFRTNQDEPIIIDCGANIGLASIHLKKHYPKSRIYAFEADQKIACIAKKNIEAFQFTDIQIIDKAVLVHDEGIHFKMEGGTSGAISTFHSGDFTPTIRLSSFLATFEQIDFLKIDIEGAEHEVLPDCIDELGKVQNLFLEYHSSLDQPQHLNKLLKILSHAGFRYHIKEAFTSDKPFLNINTQNGMDLQLDIFAYRT